MYKLAQPFAPTYARTSIECAIALVANFVSVTALDVVVYVRSWPVAGIDAIRLSGR